MTAARSNLNTDLLITTLNPVRTSITAPPQELGELPSFTNTVTVEASIAILADPVPNYTTGPTSHEGVPYSEGLILWFPQLGVESVYRFGRVTPSGSGQITADTSAAVRGLTPTIFTGPGDVGPGVGEGNNTSVTFQWLGPTVLPYVEEVLTIGPDLARNFSETRMFAGVMQLESSAVPIGNTALTGRMTAGSIADTRNISYNIEASSGPKSYASVDVLQQTMNSKDAFTLTSAAGGVTMLVGSDIAPDFTAPRQGRTDTIQGDWSNPYVLNSLTQLTPAYEVTTQPFQLLQAQAWISPWPTKVVVPMTGANGNTVTVANNGPCYTAVTPASVTHPLGTIDETGVLDVVVTSALGAVAQGGTVFDQTQSFTLKCQAVHFYCGIQKGGTVKYNMYSETVTMQSYSGSEMANSYKGTRTGPSPHIAKFEPRMFRTEYAVTGKYMGTWICLYAVVKGSSNPTTDTFILTSAHLPTVRIRARGIDKRGRKGPVRVALWEDLSAGQNLLVKGNFKVSCVPTGSAAPLIKDTASISRVAADSNAVNLLSRLYNGTSPIFRRIWRTNEYIELLKGLESMSAEDLIDSKGQDLSQDGSGAAAGVLSQLGGMFLGPVGQTVGAVGDLLLGGASGSYGSRSIMGQSAGQFGGAAGQFGVMGDAAGQFGGMAAGQFGTATAANRRQRALYD